VFADTADGLEHAHNLTVIHRDLKPSNLILDVDGRLRILDFSLAWIDGEQRLTLSRDRLGTPLYMSPEQARGDTNLIGPATDLYGLGATLYEVLTWQPPFEGRDVRDTLQQIVQCEPTAPRRLNRAIPRELETIVLKCLRKDPSERYATAKDLAEDLRAFAEGRSIKARPRPILRRATASAWRLRKAIALGAVLVGGLAVCTGLYWKRQENLYEMNILEAMQCFLRRELRAPLATLAKPRVDSRIHKLDAGGPMQGALPRQGVAVIMVAGCELVDPEARVSPASSNEDAKQKGELEQARVHIDEAIRILPRRPEAHFYLARILSDEGKHQQAAEALQKGGRLIAGTGAPSQNDNAPSAGAPLSKAWSEAGDSFARGRWTDAARGFDAALSSARVSSTSFSGWELETLVKAGIANLRAQNFERAREYLARARRIAGGMFEIDLLNLKAYCLDPSIRSVEGAEAPIAESFARAAGPRREAIASAVAEGYLDIGEFTRAKDWIEQVAEGPAKAALKMRLRRGMAMTGWHENIEILRDTQEAARLAPDDLATRLCMGNAYLANNYYKEAMGAFERAQKLSSRDPRPLAGIGTCLWAQKKFTDARASFEFAVGLDTRYAQGRYNLGVVLDELGDDQAAEVEYRAALELDPDHALARNNIGVVLWRRGQLHKAMQEFERAVDINPLLGFAHYNHGFALQEHGKFKEAAAEYGKALQLRMIDSVARKNLGYCFRKLGNDQDAYAELKQASAMDPGCAWTHQQLAVSLYHLNKSDEALAHLEKAIEEEPLWANAHSNLGLVLEELGQKEEALSRFEQAFRMDPSYVHPANDYARLVLQERYRLPEGDGLKDLMERMEVVRHLAGADEAIDRLLDECLQASESDLPTFGSIDALLDAPEVLIADGEEWKYSREASSSPSDLAWAGIRFSDEGWASGPSGFGTRGGDGVRTTLETAVERSGSLYLRRRFIISDRSRFRTLVLRVSSSRGWIAYLNGTELCHFLVEPTSARDTVLASTTEPWIVREFRAGTTLLEEGQNVIALHVPASRAEDAELRIGPVLKAVPGFGARDPSWISAKLNAFEAVAQGSDTDTRLAYLEAGIMERFGRYPEAEDHYRQALTRGGKKHEPAMGLARCLLPLGRASEAEQVLWDTLDVTLPGHLPLWREWLRLSLVDLERPPAAVLDQVAHRFGGADAMPSGALQAMKDEIWALGELAAARPLRINCGGPDSIDEAGKAWSGDKLFQGGFDFYLFNLASEHHGFPASQVYETERYFSDPRPFSRGYEIPLPQGEYKVTLHFVEGHFKPPHSRSFDVFLEGKAFLTDRSIGGASMLLPNTSSRGTSS
jgi:tetratricopeptide (TPR) repeat protein